MVEASALRAQARRVKDLTEVTIEELWQEVKEEEEWWGDVKERTLRVVKRLLEGAMEGEMLGQLRAGRYRRTELRRGYRNGYRYRSLITELGLVEGLRVSRDRDGEYSPGVVARYKRRQEKVNRLVRDMFLRGVSTRKVQEVMEPLLGAGVSAQTVSRITRSLDAEVQRYQERPLEDCYLYLLLDGITLKVKGLQGRRSAWCCVPMGSPTKANGRCLAFVRPPRRVKPSGKPFSGTSTSGACEAPDSA